MTATFFLLTPMIDLSGFTIPIENMLEWIQYATYAIPLRNFLDDRARHLPEGRRRGRALAADGRAAHVRSGAHLAGTLRSSKRLAKSGLAVTPN